MGHDLIIPQHCHFGDGTLIESHECHTSVFSFSQFEIIFLLVNTSNSSARLRLVKVPPWKTREVAEFTFWCLFQRALLLISENLPPVIAVR